MRVLFNQRKVWFGKQHHKFTLCWPLQLHSSAIGSTTARAPAALLRILKIAGMSGCRFDSALPKVTRCCKERTMCWAGNIGTGLSLQLCGIPSRKCRLSTAPPLDSPNAQGVLCFGGGDNLGRKIASSFFGTSQEWNPIKFYQIKESRRARASLSAAGAKQNRDPL